MLKKLLLVMGLLAGMLSVHAQTWYLEDFESLGILGPNKPEGWQISTDDHGNATFKPDFAGFESDMAIKAQMTQTNGDYWFYTQQCAFGTQPIVEFQYKTYGVVGDAPEHCLTLELAVSADGEDWTPVKTVAASDFVSSSAYTLFRATLPESYAGTNGHVRLKAKPEADAGTVSLYVDNFGVGTKAEAVANDLMIQGEISGSSMPTVNVEAVYEFTVFNNGSADQTVYSVQLLDQTKKLLASENVTAGIEAGARKEHSLKFTPTQAGTDRLYAVVVLEGDQNPDNDTATINIDVQEEGGIVVEVGNGNMLVGGQPFSFTAQTSVALALYMPEELNVIKGDIRALMFEGSFSTEITLATQVYIGETDLNGIEFVNYQAQFIDPTHFTKVFDGDMTFVEGDHQSVRFDFTQPFAYSGERTLAVYTFSRIAAEKVLTDYDANRFYATSVPMGGEAMAIATDGENIDPMKPNENDRNPKFQRPNVKFFYSSVSDEKYDITFAVKDVAGNTVENAVVTLNGQSGEAGTYVFEDMPARMYAYVVEKEGFVPARGILRLKSDTTLNITLIDMVEYPGLSGYLHEDFENIAKNQRPLNWTGSFYVEENGGKENGRRITHSFWFMDGPREIITNPVFMGSDPVFEFEYRVMDYETYPGKAFAGENLMWQVEVSEDFGETWKNIYYEDYGAHVSDTLYKPFSIDVKDYAGKICQFYITVTRDNGLPDEFYFDIDNVKIGTQLENDLAVVSKIEGLRVFGAGVKNAYTVCVRNEGKNAVESYSLKFYDGETEIGSVPGTKLESGAFAKLVYEHTFAQEGEHVLKAVLVMDDDEFAANNTTSEFYVSVQAEGIKGSMVDAYEGEDITYSTPLSMYDNNSLSWILYNRKDLAFESGSNIGGIAFRTKFEQETERTHLVVYVGETNNEGLLQSVPSPVSLTKVFDGGITVGDRDGGNFVINFQRPYFYTGKNLVVAVYKEAPQAYLGNMDFGFYGYYSLDAVSAIVLREEEPMDLSAISLTQDELIRSADLCKPSTIFLLRDNVSYYSVSFEVTDQNGKPVTNAKVTFDGTELAAGKYKVENVPDGTYAYTVELNGEAVSGEVAVKGADVVEKVQLQHVANESNVKETMVRIYPNPTDGKLHIDLAEGAKEINLYDISGRSVRKITRVPAGIIEMNLSDCHSGIYLLKIDGRAFKVSKQ
ncbi:MAG: T9SS type A sorting domain-containing protein [Bacteroides sp.]|nr:T9SS type A sorting domain-containing protein [Ruminococcus flavefaciens]MCM1554718.1 T9SS type A sorting domain-containing protein [Bacteroides sp.]